MNLKSPAFRLITVCALLLGIVAPNMSSINGQKRKGRQQSASRAAGLVDEADKLAEDGKWAEAIEAYKIAIRIDANYAPAYGGLGAAYFNSGNWEAGLTNYKEQVRLAPNDAQAQYDVGFAYNAMGRHGEAFAPLVKAIALDPSFPEAHYEVGYAYARGDEFQKAVNFLRSAIRLKPDYAEAYYSLGEVYSRLGKPEEANQQLKKLATLDTKLARKLEKEIQLAQTAPPASKPAVNVIESQLASGTSPKTETTAPATEPVAPTEKSAARPSEMTASQSGSQPVKPVTVPSKTESPEISARQLQQVPAPQQTEPAPTSDAVPAANSALSQLGQINNLPIKSKRWALVIGVDKYMDPQISPLKGSDNDARLIADALVRYAGFPQDQVILLSTAQPAERQPTRVNILRRLSNLSTAVPRDGLLLISFAGHGMEREGQAFLLPSDSQISDQVSFLEDTAISINRMKDRIKETKVAQVLVLLDACRNDPGGRADAPNPLSKAYTNAFNFDLRNREVQAFATVYATGIGQRAYEYTEKKQGYFSWALVEGLRGGAANDKGEVTLSQLVKYVQDNVPKRIAIDLGSTKQQRPFAVIEGYRADELVVAVTNSASNTVNNATPNIAMVDPAAMELAFWDTIKNSNNPDDFKGYLDKYPDGQFAALARTRAQSSRPSSSSNYADPNTVEMSYWNAIKDSRSASDFRAYTTKFPNGLFVDLANSRISSLENEEREREKTKAASEAAERMRNTRLFEVKDGSGTEGVLTTTPGSVYFEVKKRSEKNDKKNINIPCSEIRRVEQGKSQFQPPHVNLILTPVDGKNRQLSFYTSRGGQGLFVATPVVDITANVINGVIEACNMARIN